VWWRCLCVEVVVMTTPHEHGRAGSDGLVQLDRSACMRLLAGQEVGRVVYTEAALPAVTVVTYALLGSSIVFRTTAESRLARRVPGAVVAFEVDDLDPVRRTGWSVVVTGPAYLVGEQSMLARLDALLLVPWAAGDRRTFIRISPGLMTGRRIVAAALSDPPDGVRVAGEDITWPRVGGRH
jgi:hypothetical protein